MAQIFLESKKKQKTPKPAASGVMKGKKGCICDKQKNRGKKVKGVRKKCEMPLEDAVMNMNVLLLVPFGFLHISYHKWCVSMLVINRILVL